MPSVSSIVALALGLVLGVAFAAVFRLTRGRTARQIGEELLREKEKDRRADMEAVIDHCKG